MGELLAFEGKANNICHQRLDDWSLTLFNEPGPLVIPQRQRFDSQIKQRKMVRQGIVEDGRTMSGTSVVKFTIQFM